MSISSRAIKTSNQRKTHFIQNVGKSTIWKCSIQVLILKSLNLVVFATVVLPVSTTHVAISKISVISTVAPNVF